MFHRSSIMASASTLLGLGLVTFFATAGEDPTKELQRFQGKWRLVEKMQFQGDKVTGIKPASPPPAMVIKGAKIISPAEKLELPFRLDATKNPKQIKRTIRYALGNNKFELREWLGIYTLEGDRLTICTLSPPSAEKAPKAFPERGKPAEEAVTVTILERVKDEDN